VGEVHVLPVQVQPVPLAVGAAAAPVGAERSTLTVPFAVVPPTLVTTTSKVAD
jgi:hypothetical protein